MIVVRCHLLSLVRFESVGKEWGKSIPPSKPSPGQNVLMGRFSDEDAWNPNPETTDAVVDGTVSFSALPVEDRAAVLADLAHAGHKVEDIAATTCTAADEVRADLAAPLGASLLRALDMEGHAERLRVLAHAHADTTSLRARRDSLARELDALRAKLRRRDRGGSGS